MESETVHVMYEIIADMREQCIDRIQNDLETGFSTAINSNQVIGINECPERSYIYVYLPNDEFKQYSANRID